MFGAASTSSSPSIRSSDGWTSQPTTMNGDSDATSSQPKDPRRSKEDPDSNFTAPNLQKTNSWVTRNKFLSPEFNDITDEAELGNLMGDDGEKLLAVVDDIRKIDSLRNEELHIPQVFVAPIKLHTVADLNFEIVVVGDTSTGKSSVLQALTRLPFPVAGDLCTRFVTETTIRRCSPSERPGYNIEVKMDGSSPSQVAPFPPKSFESDDWVEVFQHLREDIDDAFNKMSPDHLLPPGISKKEVHPRHGISSMGPRPLPIPQLLKHRLQITVRKPNQAHFSIVDIPGLISSKPLPELPFFSYIHP
jgi:GTPase SAR1 family protein